MSTSSEFEILRSLVIASIEGAMEALPRLPLSLILPAATALLAYLDARFQLSYDLALLSPFISGNIRLGLRERKDRCNLFYLLESHALHKTTSRRPWIMYEGRSWSYKESYDIILRYGQWLKNELGVKKGEIVALDCMNSPQFVWVWLGLWSIGAKPAFINYNLGGESLVHCVRVSTARIILVDEEVRQSFTEDVVGKLGAETVFLTEVVLKRVEAFPSIREPDEIRSGPKMQDMAILIYTSGTTGLPKPGVVSWGKANLAGFFVSTWLPLKADDRFYTCMPLYHTSAAVLGVCGTITGGSTLVIGHKFSTKTFWQDVKRHDATIIQYVGEMCRYLLAAPPAPLVTLENGQVVDPDKQHKVRIAFGNGLRPDVWKRFQERFGIDTVGEIYASTEGPSLMSNRGRGDFARGAVGRNGALSWLLVGPQVSVVKVNMETQMPWRDPATGLCERVYAETTGELLYKLDPADIKKKFQGYFGNKEASDKKIIRDVHIKGDAYFRSGDLLCYDNDYRWFFSDRLGDTFRWKSENVSTAEVAGVVGLHPAVQDANVYGVQLPNHDGRAGCAAVVLNEGKEMGPELRRTL
ncbi:MAG: hypothetical protein M1820_010931, partial [Bogoriella megaspora]